MTLADAAAYVSERFAAPPVNLLGQSLGCYRLEQDGRRLDTRSLTDDITAGSTLALVVEKNEHRRVELEVAGDSSLRMTTLISTAVPARALVAHLQSWLTLDEGRWRLEVNGETLEANEVLADMSTEDGAVVKVVR